MATTVEETELKLQGAVEAAQDPQSRVSADDVQRKIVEDSQRSGITAITLDTNATPEQRLAQAREVG